MIIELHLWNNLNTKDMKTLLFALTMMFAVSGYSQNRVTNATTYNLDTFVLSSLDQLNIDSVAVIIQPVYGMIYDKYFALIKKNGRVYTIAVSTLLGYNQTLAAVAHELIHLKQMDSGKLNIDNSNNIIFGAEKYVATEDSHYADSHEKEARDKGSVLFNNYPFKSRTK